MEEKVDLSFFESRYKDRTYIGSGGFAKVYKAFDHAQNRYVALKISDVRPEWNKFTLLREVELVNKLPFHPNIARYEACYRFDMGVAGEIDFAILKYYEDGNLEQFLQQKQVTDEDRRIIIRGILRGIEFLHRHEYVHRDLKAQNILMQREDGVWMPKITDFGLSRNLGAEVSGVNSSIGISYAYASPEQILNQKISHNVDLWAAGVLMYRILANELPFKTEDAEESYSQVQLELSKKIVSGRLPPGIEEIPEPFRNMICQCLVVDPRQRVRTASHLLDLLDGSDPMGGIISQEEHKDWATVSSRISSVPLEADKTVVVTSSQRPEPEVSASGVPDPESFHGASGALSPVGTGIFGEYHRPPETMVTVSTPVDPPVVIDDPVPPTVPIDDDPSSAENPRPQSADTHQPMEPSPEGQANYSRLWRISKGRLGLVLGLITIVSIVILWFLFIHKSRKEEPSGTFGSVDAIPVRSYEAILKDQEEAMETLDTARLNALAGEWRQWMAFYEDFRWPYQLARNQAALGNIPQAGAFVREASVRALRDPSGRHASSLMQLLEEDGRAIMQEVIRHDKILWNNCKKALRAGDATLLVQ